MTLPDLAALLWRQRELMEQLAHRLECEQLLMVSGRTGRLGLAVADVESAVQQLQVLEVQRAGVNDRVAVDLGLTPESGLAEVAVAAGAPWDHVLLEHRTALLTLSEELRALGEATRKLAGGGAEAVQLALTQLGVAVAAADGVGYDASGRTDVVTGVHLAVDQVV